MLDLNFVRENVDLVKKVTQGRGFDPGMVDRVLEADHKRRRLLAEVESWRVERNRLSHLRPDGKPELLEKAKAIKKDLQQLEPGLKEAEKELVEALSLLPNIPADDVPQGKDESENVEIEKKGKTPSFSFKVKDHLQLGEDLEILDVVRAAKVSGPRFGYFKGQGAIMEMALMRYVMELAVKKGFVAIIPPVLIKQEVDRGLGYFEHGGWDQAYILEKDGLVFVGSSEHSVIPMHKDEIIGQLPLRYVNFSTCFRRESGTYGKDTHGMFRVHQFNKVELNVYTQPEVKISDRECLDLLAFQKKIVENLGLSYRVRNACTGDLPFPNRRMYDLETWFPAQESYRETHSCSNCTDFQTRRLNIRTRTEEGLRPVHALNATGVADRTLVALWENYQQADGSVLVPEVLQKYTGFAKISPPRK